MILFFPPRHYEKLEGEHLEEAVVDERCDLYGMPAQGFRLKVDVSAIFLEAADKPGLFYGRQTLAEIFETYRDERIPCCRIEDWPAWYVSRQMAEAVGPAIKENDQLVEAVQAHSKSGQLAIALLCFFSGFVVLALEVA